MLLDNRKPAEPLTLGDAIRKGCEILPKQTFMPGRRDRKEGCALEAAQAAVGISCELDGNYLQLAQRFGLNDDQITAVWQHNDIDEWTREQIADWCDEQGIGIPSVAVSR